MAKAKILLEEKMKNLAYFSEDDFTNATKNVNDGFRMLLPTEIYKSYEAYNSSSLALTRFANVKSVTMYYQPVPDKEFDFVINLVVHEPVIQILYEIQLSIKRNSERKIAAELKASKKEKKRLRLF
ncbi:hypothetical protein [uncultured Chryseobacterium sp.]|uniref:hypothetical protein n=1 Tax=uncultured Chryseobacterium sp. TaxID=259322 RepID=UPI0025ECB950|nr:hypothetical protein [uncultured Chryseobacterium sp.]